MTQNINFYDELAAKAKVGDAESRKVLCRHFKRYIHNLAHTLYEGWDAEDAEQDLWVYFLECLLSYDESRNVHFRMYIMKHLKWYMLKHFRRSRLERSMNGPVNEAVLLDMKDNGKEISTTEEEISRVLDQCTLTPLQRKLLDTRLSGKTWQSIAEERNVSRRSMYYHVASIRRRLLENENFQNYFLA